MYVYRYNILRASPSAAGPLLLVRVAARVASWVTEKEEEEEEEEEKEKNEIYVRVNIIIFSEPIVLQFSQIIGVH